MANQIPIPRPSRPVGAGTVGLLAAVAVITTLITTQIVGPAQSGFFDGFTGQPQAPLAFKPANWAVTYYDNKFGIDIFNDQEASHGPDCAPPGATHLVHNIQDRTFFCLDHMMTAINSVGTGAVYLTPNQMVDFTNGPATIRWDMSTYRASGRDWVEMFVQPWDDELQVNGQNGTPLINGVSASMVDRPLGDSKLQSSVWRNFVRSGQPHLNTIGWDNTTIINGAPVGWLQNTFPDKARARQTFEVTLSRTHIKVCMPTFGRCWEDSDINPPLTWTRGLVQFNHRSYNPGKDCPNAYTAPPAPCGANTWHWDNVSINPSTPFAMIHGVQETAQASSPIVTFPQPAPAGAVLRFIALAPIAAGRQLQVSFNGGATYQDMPRQPQCDGCFLGDEWYKSYRSTVRNHDGSYSTLVVPAGTSEIRLRAADGNTGWTARAFELFALGAQPQVTAVPPTPIQPTVPPTLAPPLATATSALATATAILSTATAGAPAATIPPATPTSIAATATVLAITATAIAPTPVPIPCYDGIVFGDGDPPEVIRGEVVLCP